MNDPVNLHTKEPSKFNADTLTTLKLVKKYHPSFVTTFIVNRQEAHCLTGDDLRRCENMITLKKKKEINAKYSGLLKSKVKPASYDLKNKRKSGAKPSARGERPKTPRQGSARSQSKNEKVVKSIDLQSEQEKLPTDCKTKKLGMKEIFKSNVFSNFSASTVDDSAKCRTGNAIKRDFVQKLNRFLICKYFNFLDHLPTPKEIIEKTGSKIKSFWNLKQTANTMDHK